MHWAKPPHMPPNRVALAEAASLIGDGRIGHRRIASQPFGAVVPLS